MEKDDTLESLRNPGGRAKFLGPTLLGHKRVKIGAGSAIEFAWVKRYWFTRITDNEVTRNQGSMHHDINVSHIVMAPRKRTHSTQMQQDFTRKCHQVRLSSERDKAKLRTEVQVLLDTINRQLFNGFPHTIYIVHTPPKIYCHFFLRRQIAETQLEQFEH